jgi:hypothetical protein
MKMKMKTNSWVMHSGFKMTLWLVTIFPSMEEFRNLRALARRREVDVHSTLPRPLEGYCLVVGGVRKG